ncbi:MAG: chemotaxis protein CheW [Planctomycetaceae bacterium]
MSTSTEQRAGLKHSETASNSGPKQSFVVFELDKQAYGLPIAAVVEILPMAQLTRPPQAPMLLAGFLNLEGQPVPVIRLRRLFALEDEPADIYTPLVLLRSNDRRLALLVDRVCRIISADESCLVPVEDACSLNNCASGMLDVAGAVVVVLSPDRLLLEQENLQIDELTAMERDRLSRLQEAAP